MQALLNRNLVRFPFDITKASAMILAAESGAESLVWGKILYSDKRSAPMQVQLFLIDIKEPRQRHAAPGQGELRRVCSSSRKSCCRHVVGAIAPGSREIVMPQLNMALPEYEKFIKSLLLGDADKKLELLLPAAERGKPLRLRPFRTGQGLPGKARSGRLPRPPAAGDGLAVLQGPQGFPAGPRRLLRRRCRVGVEPFHPPAAAERVPGPDPQQPGRHLPGAG